MEAAVQVLAIVHFSVVGASHLLRPPSWVAFFTLLREKGHAGVFFLAFLSLGFGSLVVVFHPVWRGIPAALTLFGWAQVIKGAVYFLFPDFALRKLAAVQPARGGRFRVAGIALLALAALLAWHLVSVNLGHLGA